jgi:hypothetical protein
MAMSLIPAAVRRTKSVNREKLVVRVTRPHLNPRDPRHPRMIPYRGWPLLTLRGCAAPPDARQDRCAYRPFFVVSCFRG